MAPEDSPPTPSKSSAWSRLPSAEERDDSSKNGGSAARPRAATRGFGAGLWGSALRMGEAIRGSAGKVSTEVGEKILGAPAAADIEALYRSADLPELVAGDALGSLASRLDSESDLWRSLALRSLSRAVWADRLAQVAGVVTGLGTLGLAVIGGFGALFGASDAPARLLLLCGATGSLAAGAAIATWIAASIRKAQRDVAREAMARADLVELRLHRLSVVSALLSADADAGKQALLHLEHDTR